MVVAYTFRKTMWLDVHKFINFEMIRDGGSFACKFEGRDGNQYILFTKIWFAMSLLRKKSSATILPQEKEIVGYEKPVIIDCDPAKRPADTKPAFIANCVDLRVSWRQVRQIIGKAGTLAQGLNPIQADWFKRMTAIVEGDGHAPPVGQRARHGIAVIVDVGRRFRSNLCPPFCARGI